MGRNIRVGYMHTNVPNSNIPAYLDMQEYSSWVHAYKCTQLEYSCIFRYAGIFELGTCGPGNKKRKKNGKQIKKKKNWYGELKKKRKTNICMNIRVGYMHRNVPNS